MMKLLFLVNEIVLIKCWRFMEIMLVCKVNIIDVFEIFK